jgi:hypothetical protein
MADEPILAAVDVAGLRAGHGGDGAIPEPALESAA